MASYRSDPIFYVHVNDVQLSNVSDPKLISMEFVEGEDSGRSMTFKVEDFAFELLDNPSFVENTPVFWRYGYHGDMSRRYKGLIGEVAPEYSDSGCILTITVFDGIVHYLGKARPRNWFKDGKGIKASEIVEQIAAANGMNAVVEPTKGLARSGNQGGRTDWKYIQDLSKDAKAMDAGKRGTYMLSFSADMKTLYWKPTPVAGPIKKVYTYYIENENPEIIRFAPRSKPHDPKAKGADGVTTARTPLKGEPDEEVKTINATNPDVGASDKSGATVSLATGAGVGTPDMTGAVVQNLRQEDSRAVEEDLTAEAEAKQQRDELNKIEADLEVIMEPQLRAGHNIGIRNVGKKFSGRYLIHEMRVVIDESGGRSEFWLKRNAVGDPSTGNAAQNKRPEGDTPTHPEDQPTVVSLPEGRPR